MYRFLLAIFVWGAMLPAAIASAAERVIVVLDASGSMWGQIDGRPKLEIAREALQTVLDGIPPDREIGFMAYGHREKGSCSDIELLVPPAAGTSATIEAAADRLQFLGKTPLTESVREAATALRSTEEKATVVLITDGTETCDADPCALGRDLEQSGVDFTAHVVGFGLTAQEGRQVACLAETTGGRYFQAGDAASLARALTETIAATPAVPAADPAPVAEPPVVAAAPSEPSAPMENFRPRARLSEAAPLLPDGASVAWEIYKLAADGSRGVYVATEYGNGYAGRLEPGDYLVTARLGEARAERRITVAAAGAAETPFVLDAGTLVIRPRPSPGAPIADHASVYVDYAGEGATTSYGQTHMEVPAGPQEVTVKIGEGVATLNVDVPAGATVERDVVVGVGRLVVTASYAPGMRVEDSGLAVTVYKAAKALDGSRDMVTVAYGTEVGFDLPAGAYSVLAEMQEAQTASDVEVKVGERRDLNILLDAGVASISAPGASSIEIFDARKSIQGERKSIAIGYGESFQTTLPAGDYVAVADRGGAKSEAAVSVKAGGRADVAMR